MSRVLSFAVLMAALAGAIRIGSPGAGGAPFADPKAFDITEAPVGGGYYTPKASDALPAESERVAAAIPDPVTPDGYELVFGPVNAANDAPGYMGFVGISTYNATECADLCNARDFDAVGGACKFFNLFNTVVNGTSVLFSCSFYYIPTDATTATNAGQGNITIEDSRGYSRISVLPDGDFESFTCPTNVTTCFSDTTATWVGTSSTESLGVDAAVIRNATLAHSGNVAGILGEVNGADAFNGTLAPVDPLTTIVGKTYTVSFFHWSGFANETDEAAAFVDVLWNGEIVLSLTPGFSPWQYYQTSPLTAIGNDTLAFRGGSAPAWSFIDDISVFRTTTTT